MFWRKKKKTGAVAGKEEVFAPDISEPIKSFIKASHRWKTELKRLDEHTTRETFTDPETGFVVEMYKICSISSSRVRVGSPKWLTPDERDAIQKEHRRIIAETLRKRRAEEQQKMRTDREKWAQVYESRIREN